MAQAQFLHGVEVVEIDSGPRAVRTVRSAVIGIIGTAPDASGDTKAAAQSGTFNSGLAYTAKLNGAAGNAISVRLRDPSANSAALSVTVTGYAIVVNLATSSGGAVTSTAAQVKAAIEASVAANALVSVGYAAGGNGSGVVRPNALPVVLTGGEDEPFPLNKPRLIAGSRAEAAKLGGSGTLPGAVDLILDQIGAFIVVVRVAEGEDDEETVANVIGGVTVGGDYEGVHAFLSANQLGVTPRVLIAPGFTGARGVSTANPVIAELVGIADRLRAVIIADGPNSTDAAAIQHREDWGTRRVYIVDPAVVVRRGVQDVVEPASSVAAGLIARVDYERGFWWSPSNQTINGIIGTARPIDFTLGDPNCRANYLNENEVATIIREDGFRLWGNRTASSDPKWAFLSVVRANDIIMDSILRAHLWAVDRAITRQYFEEVAESVNAYLRDLKKLGAIAGGECYPDPDLNSAAAISDGRVYFNVRWSPTNPAEHVIFRAMIVNDFIEELI